MTHPPPYPLPFPNEAQRTPSKISSYSSLAGALDANHSYPIYTNSPPLTNPAYPYPARNVVNPGTYPLRTPLLASNGRHPSHPSSATEKKSTDRRPDISFFYRPLPQSIDIGPSVRGSAYPPIVFERKGSKDPYTIGELLVMGDMPELVGGEDEVFSSFTDRFIKINIVWPGYTQFPFEKRLFTKSRVTLTRRGMLATLAGHVDEFARYIQEEEIPVERGQEQWTMEKKCEGSRTLWQDCVITGLHHVTGCTWKPEIHSLRGYRTPWECAHGQQ
ncbi:hypothetical protein F5I97DRAFT_2036932 [Phlebopus sp. FC_14]|nr:hypothetical protein F5I97DRAFT_2036932 [Phlebopus sp. FC_14]